MENPTPFDLNEAIRRWQQDLAASPAFCADNLEELASHLRASVQKLTATGLSEKEAFQIAIRRTGERGPLAREFAKVNSPVAWSHTVFVFWLVVGMFLLQVAYSLTTSFVFSLISYKFRMLRHNGPVSVENIYAIFVSWPFRLRDLQFGAAIAMVLVFFICARLAVGDWKRFNGFIRCFEHPFRAALCLTALALVSTPFPALAALNLVWVLAMVFLARRALRNNTPVHGPSKVG